MTSVRAGILLLGLAFASAGAAERQPLESNWAGGRVSVIFDRDGAIVKSDCAKGRLVGPIRFDRRGHFTALGSFEVYKPGPQLADAPIKSYNASFSGHLHDDIIDLKISRDGQPMQRVTLRRNASVKFVRCL